MCSEDLEDPVCGPDLGVGGARARELPACEAWTEGGLGVWPCRVEEGVCQSVWLPWVGLSKCLGRGGSGTGSVKRACLRLGMEAS